METAHWSSRETLPYNNDILSAVNESGFRPPLCTYRLNWARRASWGWWDDWDDTVLQTQDSKFEPWRSEGEHATSRSRRLPTILTFTRGWGRNIFVSFKPLRPGTEPRTLAWKAAVLTTTLGPPPWMFTNWSDIIIILMTFEQWMSTNSWAIIIRIMIYQHWMSTKSWCIIITTKTLSAMNVYKLVEASLLQ